MNKFAKKIISGVSFLGVGYLGYVLGREKTRTIRKNIRNKIKEEIKLNQLQDSLKHYEEVWTENGEKCKYIIEKNGDDFIKLEKRGKKVSHAFIEEDELNCFIKHLEDVIWPQGCLFTKECFDKKSYGRCKFNNDIELYVNPFYFFKGNEVNI